MLRERPPTAMSSLLRTYILSLFRVPFSGHIVVKDLALRRRQGEGTTLSKSEEKTKSLGEAIDEIINALTGLSESARRTAIRAASEHLKIQVNSESVSATIEDAKTGVRRTSCLANAVG